MSNEHVNLNTQEGNDFVNMCLCVNCRNAPSPIGVRFSDDRPKCSNCGREIDETIKPEYCEHESYRGTLSEKGMCVDCFIKWIDPPDISLIPTVEDQKKLNENLNQRRTT